MRIVLVHGMGRTSVSLALLASRLRRAGHQTSSFGYFVTRQPLAAIADDFVAHIERHVPRGPPDPTGADKNGVDVNDDVDDSGYAIVSHSLGGIVTRLALPRLQGLQRLVMLGPPNQPPALAGRLQRNPIFRGLTRDAGQKLANVDDFYRDLPVPTMPTLIVAGTAGPRFKTSPWQGDDNDGIVGLEESKLLNDDGTIPANVEHVELPLIHTVIMNNAEATRRVLRFLAPTPA